MVSDEPQHTYTAREIILELFPATDAALIPGERACQLERREDGQLLVFDRQSLQAIVFIPIPHAGKASIQVCCDICECSMPRGEAEMLRAEVPGTHGRRYRYICVCRDTLACDARRLGDRTVRELLARVLRP